MTVTSPYDPTWKALDWAKANCPSYITNAGHPAQSYKRPAPHFSEIDYFFGDERDALIFALRWK